jgi:hypothetical protein
MPSSDGGGGRGTTTTTMEVAVGSRGGGLLLQEVPGCADLGHRGDGGDGDVGIIPVSDHDYPIDIVLTPSRTLILRNFRMARDAVRTTGR